MVGRGPRGAAWEAVIGRRRDMRCAGTVDPDPRAGATWPRLSHEALAAADAAVIASPPELHAAQALACLGAGRAVLVEKPLALTVSDAQAVAGAARAAGRAVVVGQNFAYRPLERAVGDTLHALGPLRSGAMISARSAAATPAHAAGLEQPLLWDFAIHHFDLIRRRAGGPPSHVEASRRGDGYAVSFLWPSGLEVGWRHDDGGALFHRSEWWRADHGAVEVHGADAWRIMEGVRPRRLRLPRGSAEDRLLDALVRGEADVEENIATVAMVAATVAALDAAGPVELPSGAGAV